jgi:hypothetical protein
MEIGITGGEEDGVNNEDGMRTHCSWQSETFTNLGFPV